MVLQRRMVLCADDFGLTDAVSRGILDLAGRGRISATSAMTNMPGWRRAAPGLKAHAGRIAVGIHLNLTTGAPLGPMPRLAPGGALPPLGPLIRGALRGGLPAGEIRDEVLRQVAAFEEAHGAPPDFVDGHQHVHALPGVRQAVLSGLAESGYAGRLWLRDPTDRLGAVLRRPAGRRKAMVVNALATGFRQAARTAGFDTNDGFSGFSPLDLSVDPRRVFESAVRKLGPRPVVMCHPGHVDEELRRLDPAVESRAAELAYLQSDAFADMLGAHGIVLARDLPR